MRRRGRDEWYESESNQLSRVHKIPYRAVLFFVTFRVSSGWRVQLTGKGVYKGNSMRELLRCTYGAKGRTRNGL
jgi:hypothetical protein